MAAALAVRSALKEFHIDARLKWPNDVMVNARKIAGILAEAAQPSGPWVLGIGVNVNLDAETLARINPRTPATSMAIETNRACLPDDVFAVLRQRLEEKFDIAMTEGLPALRTEWIPADFLAGKTVDVQQDQAPTLTGRYAGLADDGRLVVHDDAGHEHTFWSGDVTVQAMRRTAP